MFKLAFLIGIYSYFIFLLGLLHLLKKDVIFISTLSFFAILVVTFWKKLVSLLRLARDLFSLRSKRVCLSLRLARKLLTLQFVSQIGRVVSEYSLHFKIYIGKNNKLSFLLIFLIAIQILINLIGALGPELAFDALWYHLTIPKIYLEHYSIFYIGGHLYYSAMPKLTEMFYLVSLSLGNEITAKIIHLLFGVGTLITLYKISRSFLSPKDSLLVCLIFYSNLVVGWMSITAYIDLARTFFETLALWSFLIFVRSNFLRWLALSAVMLGFAVSCKLLSLWSIIIYLCLLFYLGFSKKVGLVTVIRQSLLFCMIVFLIVSPWLIFSYLNTNFPFYPFFSPLHQNLTESTTFSLFSILNSTWSIFLRSADPISPIYFICLPLIIFYLSNTLFKVRDSESRLLINILLIYLFLGFIILYFTPLASSGRFITPYLPAFSLLVVLLINFIRSNLLYKFLLIVILIISISSILYRGIANKRFIPVILGKEDISTFMLNNLEFHVGNFYDVDNFFAKNIKPDNRVLIYGISNLYYVNFPYIHNSWIKKGDKFDYILIKDIPLPERFKDWNLVYKNEKTKVKLYSLNGKKVEY